MPHTNTQTIQGLIAQSQLLSAEQKEALLHVLPSLSPEHENRLQEIFREEDVFLSTFTERVLSDALENNDSELLRKLDAFFLVSGRKLRKAEEGTERAEEHEQLEHFFDEADL